MSFFGDTYRPTKASQLIGESQLKIWQSLERNFKEGKIFNKLMLIGDYGLGKTTIGQMYCRLILSMDSTESLDNKIIHVNCADNNGKDYHRSLVDQLNRRPLDGKYKIFFLDEIHNLKKDGAQEVWQTPLESLPDYVIIVAATTKPTKLEGGIKSRFEKLYLKKPSNSELKRKAGMIITHLKKTGQSVNIANDDIDEIINLSQGNIRDFDGYLQSKIEGRFNELEPVKQNKLIFDLIYHIDKKGNNLESKTKWLFNEVKELEIDYVSFADMGCRVVIGILRNGKAKEKTLGRCYNFLECFGDGLSPYVDSYISLHTGLKRYLENA